MGLEFVDAGFAYPGRSGDGFEAPVVEGLNFSVGAGEVVLLCGGSGCGKSTALKMANGLVPHHERGCMYGEVRLDGVALGELAMHEIAGRVASVFQNPKTQMFNAEVRSELAFCGENLGREAGAVREAVARAAADFEVEGFLGKRVFELSGGEAQRVCCAAAEASGADVLVLDEPSSNLDVWSIDALRRYIARWKAEGKAVLIAEHRVYYLRELVDKVLFIEDGHVVRTWTGDEFRALGAAETDALGLRRVWPEECGVAGGRTAEGPGPAAAGAGAATTDDGGPLIPGTARVRGLTCDYDRGKAAWRALDVPEFELPLGVPVAVVGKNGAGKSTLLRSLAGIAKGVRGTVELPWAGPLDAARRTARCALVMQDVTRQLFCSSVADEVRLGDVCSIGEAREALAHLDLLDYADAHPLTLSGGQKQRLCVASAIAAGRDIVLFDEPTSGLDLAHMHQVASLVREVAAAGRLVLVVSHDYEFVCACCGHALELEGGRVAGSWGLDGPAGASRLRDFFWSDLEEDAS